MTPPNPPTLDLEALEKLEKLEKLEREATPPRAPSLKTRELVLAQARRTLIRIMHNARK